MAREAAAGLKVTAPAKLTVSLRVTGRRSDRYHLLDAEMVSIDLVDELTFDPVAQGPSKAGNLEVVPGGEVLGGSGVPERVEVPLGEDNLICKALRAVDRRAHVHLLKRIPPGAGLGGGSSDAAAVLRWAGCHDLDVAASLGADVPFCMHGGRARVTGIGEVVIPLPYEHRTYTLLIPPFGCSTPAVYHAWDELCGPELPEIERAGDAGDLEPHAVGGNDLERAALAVEPRLAAWRDELARATGQTPQLAGSGSTWFVEGDFPGDRRIVVHTVPAPPVRASKERPRP